MHPVLSRQLRQRQLPLQRFKGHLRLEIRRITLPRVRHRYRPLVRAIPAYRPVRNPGATSGIGSASFLEVGNFNLEELFLAIARIKRKSFKRERIDEH